MYYRSVIQLVSVQYVIFKISYFYEDKEKEKSVCIAYSLGSEHQVKQELV